MYANAAISSRLHASLDQPKWLQNVLPPSLKAMCGVHSDTKWLPCRWVPYIGGGGEIMKYTIIIVIAIQQFPDLNKLNKQVSFCWSVCSQVQISPQCTFCLYIVKKLEEMLPKERTEVAGVHPLIHPHTHSLSLTCVFIILRNMVSVPHGENTCCSSNF